MPGILATTMAVIESVCATDGSNILQTVQRPTPNPRADEVLIRVAATGLTGAARQPGSYVPYDNAGPVLGLEISGTVVALGSKTSGIALGDKVCALVSEGGYAEYCLAPYRQVLPIPKAVDLVRAGGLMENLCTVWVSLFDHGGLKPGKSVLIHGGTGGIGVMAIQLAAAIGARVFATAGSDDKCRACKQLGAEWAINYRREDFAQIVREAMPQGVDVILDIVAASYFQQNIKALAVDGRLCVIGLRGGTQTQLDLADLMQRRLTIVGSALRSRHPDDKAKVVREVHKLAWPLIDGGRLKLVVDSTFPFLQVNQAHERLAAGDHIGKILLTIADTTS